MVRTLAVMPSVNCLLNINSDMRMKDPVPTFRYLAQQLAERHPRLSYVHVVEPRVNGSSDRKPEPGEVCARSSSKVSINESHVQSNDFIREVWQPRALISAGGYTRDLAIEVAEQRGDLVAFGRHYIPNVRSKLLCCTKPD